MKTKHCNVCSNTYTPEQFEQLEFLGYQPVPGYPTLELRDQIPMSSRNRLSEKARELMGAKHCNVCASTYTPEQFEQIRLTGYQPVPGWPTLELRECPCGTTLAREMKHGANKTLGVTGEVDAFTPSFGSSNG